MRLKKAVPKAVSDESSRRGRMAKRKGGNYERLIAKKFHEVYGIELKRTPQSGGFAKSSILADDFRGDITLVDEGLSFLLHVECKNQRTWKLKEWLHQSRNDCPPDRIPLVVFHEDGTSSDYVALPLERFLSLVHLEDIVRRRGE